MSAGFGWLGSISFISMQYILDIFAHQTRVCVEYTYDCKTLACCVSQVVQIKITTQNLTSYTNTQTKTKRHKQCEWWLLLFWSMCVQCHMFPVVFVWVCTCSFACLSGRGCWGCVRSLSGWRRTGCTGRRPASSVEHPDNSAHQNLPTCPPILHLRSVNQSIKKNDKMNQ